MRSQSSITLSDEDLNPHGTPQDPFLAANTAGILPHSSIALPQATQKCSISTVKRSNNRFVYWQPLRSKQRPPISSIAQPKIRLSRNPRELNKPSQGPRTQQFSNASIKISIVMENATHPHNYRLLRNKRATAVDNLSSFVYQQPILVYYTTFLSSIGNLKFVFRTTKMATKPHKQAFSETLTRARLLTFFYLTLLTRRLLGLRPAGSLRATRSDPALRASHPANPGLCPLAYGHSPKNWPQGAKQGPQSCKYQGGGTSPPTGEKAGHEKSAFSRRSFCRLYRASLPNHLQNCL